MDAQWITTAALAGFAGVIWWMGRRVIVRLDELRDMMATELRGMDVRIARIESHIWPDRHP